MIPSFETSAWVARLQTAHAGSDAQFPRGGRGALHPGPAPSPPTGSPGAQTREAAWSPPPTGPGSSAAPRRSSTRFQSPPTPRSGEEGWQLASPCARVPHSDSPAQQV